MTPERKKSIIVIGVTFFIGLTIGILSMAFLARHHYRGGNGKERNGREMHHAKRSDFVEKIMNLIDADEQQQVAVRPILEKTVAQIDSLQSATNTQMQAIVDSMEQSLDAHLSSEQMTKLQRFDRKVKGRKNEDGNRHR